MRKAEVVASHVELAVARSPVAPDGLAGVAAADADVEHLGVVAQ
jgi:hypothetical protein